MYVSWTKATISPRKHEENLDRLMNKEILNRIKVSVAAYAYEVCNESIISDKDFDTLCGRINPDTPTGNEVLDRFFKEEFDPSTGLWVWNHPDFEKLEELYNKYYSKKGEIG